MKNNFFKNVFVPRLITALLVAAPLSLTLLSSVYYLGFNVSDLSSQTATSYAMSILSLISWVLATFLVAFYKKNVAGSFFALVWWVCFLSYVAFFIFGAENIFSDSFFGTLTLVFSLPAWSYLSLVEAFEFTNLYFQITASLLPAFAIAVINTVITIKINASNKRIAEEENNG